jgi:hypothetical protein
MGGAKPAGGQPGLGDGESEILTRGRGFGRGFGATVAFAEVVDVGAIETLTVGFAVVFAVAFAVAFEVGDGVGLFVAASAVLPEIVTANMRKIATFFNRAPT